MACRRDCGFSLSVVVVGVFFRMGARQPSACDRLVSRLVRSSAQGTIDAAWQLEGEWLVAGQHEEAARLRERYVTPLLQAKPDSLSPQLTRMADNIRETEREEAQQATTVTAKASKG